MQRLRRGDPAGLEALMDRYTPYLSAIAARVLPGRPQDWEELTADVFLAAWGEPEEAPAGEGEGVAGGDHAEPVHQPAEGPSGGAASGGGHPHPLGGQPPAGAGGPGGRPAGAGGPGHPGPDGPGTLDRVLLLRTDRGPGGGGDGIEPVHRQEPPAPGAGEIKGTAGKGGV